MRRPGEFPQHVRDALTDRDDPCAVCGKRFVPGDVIEIDHIYALEQALKDPYYQEDPNGIDNAVRLHKACHDLKGFATRGARKWQARGWLTFMDVHSRGERRFALEAAMGSGKSSFYVQSFLGWRDHYPQAKLLVVCPSTQIALGICQTAYRRGLSPRAYVSTSPGQMEIEDARGRKQLVEVSNSYEVPPSHVDVCVVNFQGLSRERIGWAHRLFRAYPTMFVGDEWHHSSMNVNHDWGRSAARLLYHDWDGEDGELLPQMLMLGTGTPHRTDRERLPGWPYRERYEDVLDEHGDISTQLVGHEIAPHFPYTLREAVLDGVVLPLLLSVYSAERGWTQVRGEHVTEGSTPLNERTYQHAVRDPETWAQLIPQAVLAMRQRQRFHPKGQLLIIAPSRRGGGPSNAARIASWIEDQEDLARVVAITNETEEAQRKIGRFRRHEGGDEVAVMIKMAAEGIDLADVVGVLYLGDDRTPLALDQAAGRPNRRTPEMHPDLSAFFMGLDIPVIANWANEMYTRQPPLYHFERALENECLCGEQCSCPNCPCLPGCACQLEGGSCFVPVPEQPEIPTEGTGDGPNGPVDPPDEPTDWPPDDTERPGVPPEPPLITIDHSWVEQLVAKQIAEGIGDIRPVEEVAIAVAEQMRIAQPDAQLVVEAVYAQMGYGSRTRPSSPPPPPAPEPPSDQQICKQLRDDLNRVVGHIAFILWPKGTISEGERRLRIGRINSEIRRRASVREIDRKDLERHELERLMVEANRDLDDAKRGRSRY